jgi:hypothetical protein
MEIRSRRGMGRDRSGYISNKVRFENAVLDFRVVSAGQRLSRVLAEFVHFSSAIAR